MAYCSQEWNNVLGMLRNVLLCLEENASFWTAQNKRKDWEEIPKSEQDSQLNLSEWIKSTKIHVLHQNKPSYDIWVFLLIIYWPNWSQTLIKRQARNGRHVLMFVTWFKWFLGRFRQRKETKHRKCNNKEEPMACVELWLIWRKLQRREIKDIKEKANKTDEE